MIPKFNNQKSLLLIDLGRLKENYATAKAKIKSAECAGVVKANAYGLGAKEVSTALHEAGCRSFFVAYYEEAEEIFDSVKDSKIYPFHGLHESEHKDALKHNTFPVLNSLADVERYNNFAKSQDKVLKPILHIDTGMGRLGLTPSEFGKLMQDEKNFSHLNFEIVMSHLACGEDKDNPKNAEQLKLFNELSKGIDYKRSFANSSGIYLGSDYHFDQVRPGCMLYGINPLSSGKESPVKQVAFIYGKVLQIRTLDRDQTVSYGAKYKAKKGSKIAIISLGYADGYMRTLTGNTHCYYDGYRIPMDIRITMDLVMLDVTNIPEQKLNAMEYVEFLGDNIKVDELADNAETIGYEILTSLGSRFNKKYI